MFYELVTISFDLCAGIEPAYLVYKTSASPFMLTENILLFLVVLVGFEPTTFCM